MSDEATIEDEIEVDEPSVTARPQTKTGLLPWSFILEIVTKQWALFLILSIAIGVFLYVNGQRSKKEMGAAIRRDNVQGGPQGVSRRPPKRD